ncbi:MAG: CDP-alcohol phosphatidyltransferase family protein [Actinomycetota bacterium]|nr:CDP-alcohol phosphatidyltransferase family protein [Actinomycetota bacterium]
MLSQVRAPVARAIAPVGAALARAGVSPDVITYAGAAGVAFGAFAFYPRGEFLTGTLVIVLFVFSDMFDGAIARATGGGTPWGAFLDSNIDRMSDAAIFAALVLYFAGPGNSQWLAGAAVWCLVAGLLVSYARARAEGLGATCTVGIAERTERLTIILVGAGFAGLLDRPALLHWSLWLLAVLSSVTVVQRLVHVRGQLRPRTPTP